MSYEEDVLLYCILYLTDADELIGRMTAARLSRSQFQRGERHQGLVAQRR